MISVVSKRRLWSIFTALCTLNASNALGAAWWWEQAERLQNVSATLLDGPPISEPIPKGGFISARLLTSLLPKTNPKVGDKSEKVPAAPVHTVPTFVAGVPLLDTRQYTLSLTGWAGYLPLPTSVAKMINVNASLKQFIAGTSAEYTYFSKSLILTTSGGFQYGNATLNGAITSATAEDNFTASTSLYYLSQGIRGKTTPLWANAMFLVRRSKSKFNISLEQTEFIRTDTMSDAQVPISTQVTVGMTLIKNFQLALSEYIVPDRLIMPRVSIVYQYPFSPESNSKVGAEEKSSGSKQKSKTRKKKKTNRQNPEATKEPSTPTPEKSVEN